MNRPGSREMQTWFSQLTPTAQTTFSDRISPGATGGFDRELLLATSGMCACSRQYPSRSDGSHSLILSHQLRLSPRRRWVSTYIAGFGACMTFTLITAYTLAESPMRLFTLKAPAISLPPSPLQLLPGGTNQFPGGFIPR